MLARKAASLRQSQAQRVMPSKNLMHRSILSRQMNNNNRPTTQIASLHSSKAQPPKTSVLPTSRAPMVPLSMASQRNRFLQQFTQTTHRRILPVFSSSPSSTLSSSSLSIRSGHSSATKPKFARALALRASVQPYFSQLPLFRTQLRFAPSLAQTFATQKTYFRTTEDPESFVERHIGPREKDVEFMLKVVGYKNMDALMDANVPANIRMRQALELGPGVSEEEFLHKFKIQAKKNKLFRTFIGQGWYNTVTPKVILRNILEDPSWYTPYTPYQPEISQGRLEMLLNFQTVVMDLTGLDLAGSSLLDEATAAAEAMFMCWKSKKRNTFLVHQDVFLQTMDVLKTRARSVGIEVKVVDDRRLKEITPEQWKDVCGVFVQSPGRSGVLRDIRADSTLVHEHGAVLVVGTDLMACALATPPGEMGADICVGSAQRFGVPFGFGGPNSAFMSTHKNLLRHVPGRIIGVSKDKEGHLSYRMTMQSREQHIRRETATSNLCTAQALLANIAGAYCVYHGPDRIKKIAERIHKMAVVLSEGLSKLGYVVENKHSHFDTLTVLSANKSIRAKKIVKHCAERNINIHPVDEYRMSISMDELATPQDVEDLWAAFAEPNKNEISFSFGSLEQELGTASDSAKTESWARLGGMVRTSKYMTHEIFQKYHSETEMLRYLKRLANKDYGLQTGMIPLGSCTMKLNATAEMIPVTWAWFSHVHPYAPWDQTEGYLEVIRGLKEQLEKVTGMDAVCLQPNSGAQGEYTGLACIKAYHQDRGESHRDICLIPSSAHGTNPASAVVAGYKVVTVACQPNGYLDMKDFQDKLDKHRDNIGAMMITYPSTYGIFEENVKEVVERVHETGGLVYLDGANMNSQVGLTSPGLIGADVCHLNLHKTFCIPHGGGGPGSGPIGVAAHLAPYLPSHAVVNLREFGGTRAFGAVTSAPFGSAGILPIPYAYIKMMGGDGLKKASEIAILNANYVASMLKDDFKILFTNNNGLCAHEVIIDCRPFKAFGITEEDVAKRLMDFSIHAPTQSWPVPGTLMLEPTESESLEELNRFITAMKTIRKEIRDVEEGRSDPKVNPLKMAPHTMFAISSESWDRGYSREQAAFPVPSLRQNKFWPSVSRVEQAWGDRNIFCSCPPIEFYNEGDFFEKK